VWAGALAFAGSPGSPGRRHQNGLARRSSRFDQARVLDHADLVVCHGGSGTALASLAAGVPLVMVPLFADQFENARRIAKTRAGRIVEPQITEAGVRSIDTAAAPKITKSIEDLLEDVTHRDRARAIAAEMAATATVDEVLTRLPRGHR
jgi:UDP:flavonoid glycosyltransferase YjiC (YdhE family)